MVWYGMVWYGMVWYGMVWYGMVWSGIQFFLRPWEIFFWLLYLALMRKFEPVIPWWLDSRERGTLGCNSSRLLLSGLSHENGHGHGKFLSPRLLFENVHLQGAPYILSTRDPHKLQLSSPLQLHHFVHRFSVGKTPPTLGC